MHLQAGHMGQCALIIPQLPFHESVPPLWKNAMLLVDAGLCRMGRETETLWMRGVGAAGARQEWPAEVKGRARLLA